MANVFDALEQAFDHHQAGRLEQAEQQYRQILAGDPNCAHAWHLLGMVRLQGGHADEACDFIGRAIAIEPNVSDFHVNLGNAQKDSQNWPDAITSYRHALKLDPNSAATCNNLANVLYAQGELDEAIGYYRTALQFSPEHISAMFQMASALRDQSKWDEAAATYRRVVAIRPDLADAWYNLGLIHYDLRQFDQATTCFRRAIDARSDYGAAWFNLAIIHHDQGRWPDAVECYRRAAKLKPDSPHEVGCLTSALQHVCQWDELPELAERAIALVGGPAQPNNVPPMEPLHFIALPIATTGQQQFQCARKYVAYHYERSQRPQLRPIGREAGSTARRPLKIGYLSSDLRDHAVGLLIGELLERHDRGQVHITAYSTGLDDGGQTRRRIAAAVDAFVDLSMQSPQHAAQKIAQDRVDILVDLNGHTMGERTEILSYRPAPLQVSYLGYAGTMGASFIDYILVDDYVVPAAEQSCYSEQLVHLPGCFQVNDSQREIAPVVPSRAECGLPGEGFVFCSFSNSYKISPAVFDAWMRLLQAVPGSVLWLSGGNPIAPGNLRREAAARGVTPDRLVFSNHVPGPLHLARHRQADLVLDTFPYNAHATASDALWAGLPILTISGETYASRVAGSLLTALGLPELITTNLNDYYAMALRLATQPTLLAEIKARLEANRMNSRLFDAAEFARNLEQAYLAMWNNHIDGKPPGPLSVSRA